MKRGQRNIEMRPDVSRRRKPCSKIEAKLRSRRQSKLDNDEMKSPRLRKTMKNSSSESEISPRLFTSKQHVELVNFESRKIVPLYRKYSQNSREIDEEATNMSKGQIQSFDKEPLNSREIHKMYNVETKHYDEKIDRALNLMNDYSKNLFDYSFEEELNDSKSIGQIAEDSNFEKNHSKKEMDTFLKKEFNKSKDSENCEFNKNRRSRSAPCTPLFKIKCSKDKYPRDLLVSERNLADNEFREKISKYRKNAPLSLRISRSGDVSVSSREKSSNERIIERTSFDAPNEEEKLNELILFTKDSQKIQTDEETNAFKDFPINETTDNGTILPKEETNELEEKIESTQNSEVISKNSEIFENIVEVSIANVEIQEDQNITGDEKIVEIISPIEKNPVKTNTSKNIAAKHFSPRKLPKKREFKWETLMEKRHRQSASRSPENCKKSSVIIEKGEDDKFKFWTAKTANVTEKNSCPKPRNSFEEKKFEAYSVIREELPKLWMKRKILDAMKNKRNEIDDKTTKCREINQLNLQNLKNTTINRRASILKRRKTPSPRRVTFRLPGRFIDEKSSQEEINFTKNHENEKIELETAKKREIKNLELSECSAKNSQESLERFTEKMENDEQIRNFCAKEKLRQHDGLLNFCIEEKARRFHAEISLKCKETKNVSIPPRFYAVHEQEDFQEFEDSEQDWETPTSEDIYRTSKDVKFPKETREAMKILLRTKDNVVRCDHFGNCQKRITDRRDVVRKREENFRTENLPVVSTYAKTLAKFQESCDRDCHQSLALSTRQNRGSRNANVAVGK